MCPLICVSKSRRKETIALIHRQMTPWMVIRRMIQKTIHGLEIQTGKLAMMKSIDIECVCCREFQVVEQVTRKRCETAVLQSITV